jgi:hypothetical protein
MQLSNFINVFLARHVSGTYAHHQEHWMLSCSICFSAPSFWMGDGLESHCVGRVYSADGAWHHLHRKHDPCSGSQDQHPSKNSVCTIHMTYAASLKITTHPKTRCRKPHAATQHLMLLMMGVCTRNMLS